MGTGEPDRAQSAGGRRNICWGAAQWQGPRIGQHGRSDPTASGSRGKQTQGQQPPGDTGSEERENILGSEDSDSQIVKAFTGPWVAGDGFPRAHARSRHTDRHPPARPGQG